MNDVQKRTMKALVDDDNGVKKLRNAKVSITMDKDDINDKVNKNILTIVKDKNNKVREDKLSITKNAFTDEVKESNNIITNTNSKIINYININFINIQINFTYYN